MLSDCSCISASCHSMFSDCSCISVSCHSMVSDCSCISASCHSMFSDCSYISVSCHSMFSDCSCISASCHSMSALDISTGPLARRTFQTAGPVRASTFYLSLARTGHPDICRATRFQIVLARTMTIHSVYFSRGRPSHISAVFAQPFCYSETPACHESESGMSIKHTDVSV